MLEATSLGQIWCRARHNAIQWPIHGEYQCRTCGRRYSALADTVTSASRPALRGRTFLSLLSVLLPAVIVVYAVSGSSALGAEPVVANAVDGAADAFARYTATQSNNSQWQVETVEIEASLPKLAKQGRLRAIRRVLPFGRPQYQVLETTGDQMVKREVIARYLSEDVHASELPSVSVAITPANYKFHYKGFQLTPQGPAYIFTITPRKKRIGLIKGELWLDGATGSAVRQSGYLVKRSSIFVKRIDVAREIRLRDGVAEARFTHLTIDTRLAGKAELTIEERPFDSGNSDNF